MSEEAATFRRLIDHLHRGGAYGYFWTTSEAKDEKNEALEKVTFWHPAGEWSQLPADTGEHGPRHLYFGVHPTIASGTKGQRAARGKRDLAAINCIYAEFDAKDFAGSKAAALRHIENLATPPSVVIDSGGGYHCYWLLAETFPLHTPEAYTRAKQLQANWVPFVNGDSEALDLNRVLRIPGTLNYKSAYSPDFPTVTVHSADFSQLYHLAALEALLPKPQPRAHTSRAYAATTDTEQARALLSRLSSRRCEDYRNWLAVGMALSELGNAGLSLWETWSQQSPKYKEGECARKWSTFTPGDGITLGSLYHWARWDDPFAVELESEPVPGTGALSERFAAAVDVPPVQVTSGENGNQGVPTEAPAVSEISDIPPALVAIVRSADCAELLEENRRLQAREAAYIARVEALEAENAALREERDSLYARVDELEDTQAQAAKLWRHKHLDLKQRAALANLMQDTRGETREDGKRVIPASSYRQMSDRYNIPVSTLQNAIRPLKAAGILQTEEQKRWDQDGEMLDHPITTDVMIVFDPAQLLPVFPLEPSKRAAATKANTEARQKELKDLAEIGRAIKEAKCPKCKKTGCMELYCSTYAEIIPQSMLEQDPQVQCTTPPAPAESPAPATGPGTMYLPEEHHGAADTPPGTLYPPKEKTGGTLYPSPQDGTGDRLAGKWKNPKPWAVGDQPSTATAAD